MDCKHTSYHADQDGKRHCDKCGVLLVLHQLPNGKLVLIPKE